MQKNLLKVLSNSLVKKGKKIKIERVCFNFLLALKKGTSKNPLLIFNYSIDRVRPLLTLKNKKVAGTNLKIPVLVNSGQDTSMSIKWLVESLKTKAGNDKVATKITQELTDILSNKGLTIKKKNELHKTALANRPFLKYL
jgi:small subunit ribosomal protein S7